VRGLVFFFFLLARDSQVLISASQFFTFISSCGFSVPQVIFPLKAYSVWFVAPMGKIPHRIMKYKHATFGSRKPQAAVAGS